MLLWRIAREIHIDTPLEGVGGLIVSGRWHRRGQPILNASANAALAALEVLVHVEPMQAPDDLRLLGLDLPEDLAIETLDPALLPEDWRTVPAQESTQYHRQRLAPAQVQRGPEGPLGHRSGGKQRAAQSTPPRHGPGAHQQQRGLSLRFQVALRAPWRGFPWVV